MFYASNITIWTKFIVWNTGRVNCPSYITNTAVLNYLWLMSLCFTKCSQSRTGIIHVWSGKYFVETDYRVALTEFNLAILILLIRDGLSMCSIWYFMLSGCQYGHPKTSESVTFIGWPYIVIDVSLVTFLCEKLIRCVFPGLTFILNLSHQVRIWFRYFCNLRLIPRIRIPGACAQITMSSANRERFTCASRSWGMSLTYKIN